ncbi:hypothetical protein [Halocola ammonii]
MEPLVILLIIVIIIGAILGGKSFGGTIRKGCGCLGYVVIALVVIILLALIISSMLTSESDQEIEIDNNSVHYISKDGCPIYTKPNIEPDTVEFLEVGQEFFVKEEDRFKYFYSITHDSENVWKKCFK